MVYWSFLFLTKVTDTSTGNVLVAPWNFLFTSDTDWLHLPQALRCFFVAWRKKEKSEHKQTHTLPRVRQTFIIFISEQRRLSAGRSGVCWTCVTSVDCVSRAQTAETPSGRWTGGVRLLAPAHRRAKTQTLYLPGVLWKRFLQERSNDISQSGKHGEFNHK